MILIRPELGVRFCWKKTWMGEWEQSEFRPGFGVGGCWIMLSSGLDEKA